MSSVVPAEYKGSTFREVREQLFSDPYDKLPTYTITLKSFFGLFRNKLFAACHRALNDPSDMLPRSQEIQKLVHPLGIALTGNWKITEENPYTGCFKQGFQALVVVRSSVLLYKTERGSPRGFAFAAKLFPTLDPDERVKTIDLFTIDVLAGTLSDYYTEVALTNEPPLGFNSDVFRLFWVVLVTFATFFRANFNPVFRPLYRLAEFGLKEGEQRNMPQWIMIKADPSCAKKADKNDLRDELRVEYYPDRKLIFNISVAPRRLLPDGQKDWKRIGRVELTESVTSHTCDHRLVFNHPKLETII
jgi:hypothetical protein